MDTPAADEVGDPGGGNQVATTDGGENHGNNGDNPERIVDDVLAVLPAPSRDHFFGDDFGLDFHSEI